MGATYVEAARDERTKRVLAQVDVRGLGLEIGPSYNPLLPKSSGARVEIVDHAPQADLIEKYRGYGMTQEELDRIEEVDHVSAGGSLVDAVGRTEEFDFILASHVIEHSVDLIGFLQDCQALLRRGGRVALVVPDQRFCFDLLKPRSSVGAVVDAHLNPTRFHTPGALLEHTAYACTRGGQIAWSPEEHGDLALQFPTMAGADEVIAQGTSQDEYHDVHRWKFTPSSFALLIQDLSTLGYHDLQQLPAGPPPLGFEFFVTLEKTGTRPRMGDRLELLRGAMAELAVVHNQFLPSPPDLVTDLERERQARRDAEEALAQARQEVEDLRRSSSWRVTRPLRGASVLARRAAERARRS
jgi:predicted SAM-dependent methyltransferase